MVDKQRLDSFLSTYADYLGVTAAAEALAEPASADVLSFKIAVGPLIIWLGTYHPPIGAVDAPFDELEKISEYLSKNYPDFFKAFDQACLKVVTLHTG